jgi:Helix-turn-helix domain
LAAAADAPIDYRTARTQAKKLVTSAREQALGLLHCENVHSGEAKMAGTIEQGHSSNKRGSKRTSAIRPLLTPKDTARLLRVSDSFLAKARMAGDGPPFIKIGRSIRYSEVTLLQWMKMNQRQSTSEQ